MNSSFQKLKALNHETLPRRKHVLLFIAIVFISSAISLLLIDSDQFITYAVLLIFVSFILMMIETFLTLINGVKRLEIKLKNNFKTVYQDYLNTFHFDKNLTIDTSGKSDIDLLLVPSYSYKQIRLALHNETKDLAIYHLESSVKSGSNQTSTYFLRGLYMIRKHIDGAFQYHDQKGLINSFIYTMSKVIGDDKNDVKLFKLNKSFDHGIIYYNEENEIKHISPLLKSLRQFENIKSIKVGAVNNNLHISLELNKFNLPYIKHYKDKEMDDVKKTLNLFVDLMTILEEADFESSFGENK